MLKNKYFTDCFVLQDESMHEMHLKTFFNFIRDENFNDQPNKAENLYRNLKHFESLNQVDTRSDLHNKWASFRNMFRFQPMWDIRNYLGESNAFYFAWVGVFVSLVWVPSLIGLCFFIYGLKNGFANNNVTSDSSLLNKL